MQSHVHPRLPFFASRLRLGRDGVEAVLPLGQLNAYEEEGLKVRPASTKRTVAKLLRGARGCMSGKVVRRVFLTAGAGPSLND
jgi:hypothetical protein